MKLYLAWNNTKGKLYYNLKELFKENAMYKSTSDIFVCKTNKVVEDLELLNYQMELVTDLNNYVGKLNKKGIKVTENLELKKTHTTRVTLARTMNLLKELDDPNQNSTYKDIIENMEKELNKLDKIICNQLEGQLEAVH